MFNKKGYILNYTEPPHSYKKSCKKWHETLMNKKLNEFPYRAVPNHSKIIEFMSKVFPASVGTIDGYELVDKPYYKLGDSNYIKPKNNKEG